MLFRTHIVFSVLVYFLLLEVLIVPDKILFLVFVLFGAMIVDVDTKKSRVGKSWYLRPLQWVTKHRGIFHSLFFGVFLSVLLAGVRQWAGVGFFVGYLSHLFLDCLTKSGVKLFWPLGFRIKGFVKSGGIVEQVIFVLMLLADVFLVIRMIL